MQEPETNNFNNISGNNQQKNKQGAKPANKSDFSNNRQPQQSSNQNY